MKNFLLHTASSFFLLLGISVSVSAQTISLNDGVVVQSKTNRIGLNIGSTNYYDSGQILKNIFGYQNPGFEPMTDRQIWVLGAAGTASTFAEPEIYDPVAANYWAGGTFSVVASQSGGAEMGCTGTIASNTGPNSPTYVGSEPVFTVSSPCAGAFSVGDQVTITKTFMPTPNAWYMQNNGNGGFWPSVSNGGKFESDTTDLCPTCGRQALEIDATASSTASATASLFADGTNYNIFVLMNGTYQGSFWAKTAAGNPTMRVSVGRISTGGFSCATYSPTLTSTWAQYTFTCTASETQAATQIGAIALSVNVTGGAAYLDNISFQKISGNANNPTVLRDEVVATLQKYFGNGTPGPSAPFRYWLGQDGQTLDNWVAPDYASGPTAAGMNYYMGPNGAAGTSLSLEDYLEICQYLNLQPYVEVPVTFSNAEAAGLVEFLAGPSSTNYGAKRAALGQATPWTDVFSQIHLAFCNECWNGIFGGVKLPWRAGDTNQYYDYGVRAAGVFSAMHQDPYYVASSFDLVMNAQTAISSGMDAEIALAQPDSIEINGYTYPSVTSFANDAAIWTPAMVEPYERVTNGSDPYNFYQSVKDYQAFKKCGVNGNAACQVNIYEWGQGTQSGSLTQPVMDAINAGAGEGVIMALQPLLNIQYFGIQPQSLFALNGYVNGSLVAGESSKLWGATIDMGGATNNVRPEFLGVQLANQSIIGPMYSCPINNNATFNYAGSVNSGSLAQNNVPYLYSFCFENGTARSIVLINTDLTNSHTVTFSGTNTPSGTVNQRQYAPASLDSLNEAATGSPTNHAAMTTSIVDSTLTNPTSITLPPHSVTALDFTGSLPVASTPVFSPGAGSYTTDQLVTISNSNAGSTIYYTTDGSTPTTSSNVYSGPIAVNSSETLQAIAVESNYANSPVTSATYAIVPVLATPTFSVASGSYPTTQSVAIGEATAGVMIYYTTDGTTPTTASAVYSGPIQVSATETLKAMASGSGYTNSAIATASYLIAPYVPTPTFSVAPGTYSGTQTVTLGESQAGATVYYAIDGVNPTTAAMVYSSPITVSASETIKAFAAQTGYTTSPTATAAYTISGNTSYINIAKGGFAAPALDLNGGAAVTSAGILAVTDGGSLEARSAWNATQVPVKAFVTDFTFQQLNANADGMTFAIQGAGPTAVGTNGGALGYGGIANSVAVKFDLFSNDGEGSDSTGLYTNGSSPTVPSVNLSNTGINFHSGDVMDAHLAYDGTNLTMTLTDTATSAAVVEVFPVNIPSLVGGNTAYVGFTGGSGGETSTQEVLSWSFIATGTGATTPTAATPTFSVAPGAYTSSQSVAIGDTTAGVSIYYTTNGTTPTTSSTLYSGPIAVTASETLEAIAVETGYNTSAVASAAYTISTPALPAPSFSLAPGVYTTAQTVTISATAPSSSAVKTAAVKSGAAATAGTTVYYTTNGTAPTTSSSVYSGPITVSATETLQAMATATGYAPSPVAAAAYTIVPVLPAPTFSVAAGSYATVQSVAIADATAGATIYYTTNGTAPTTSSAVYSGPITVSATETIEAMAVESGYTNSSVASAAYTLTLTPATYISLASGGFAAGLFDLNGGATVTSTGMLQVTDGGGAEARSAWYAAQVPVQNFVTDFTFQQLDANADGMTFTIQADSAKAVGNNGGSLGYEGIGKSVAIKFDLHNNAGEGNDSTGIYTDGAAPTMPSTDLTSTAINLHSGDIMHAHLVYDGTNLTMTLTDTATNGSVTEVFPVNIPSMVGGSTAWVGFTGGTGGKTATQNILTWTYTSTAGGTTGAALTAPVFSPAGGAYTTAQSVTITELAAGATIYYTTNGATPTASSTKYTGPITVKSTETVKAIAIKAGKGSSPVSTAIYTIGATVAKPQISKAGGLYAGSLTVTISDSQSGATICFTTDGSTPTAQSNQYTGPITLTASQTLQAIAVKPGYFNSPVASAAYTVVTALATPTLSLPTGTYTGAQTVTMADSTPGALIFYTTNGTIPTASSNRYYGPITVSKTQTIRVVAAETGVPYSAVVSATYTIEAAAPAPTFSVAAGSYGATQTVTLKDSVAGLSIYYTTNGTAPTTSSTKYTGPISVSASETIQAIAAGTGYRQSAVAASKYTIMETAAVPALSVAAGTYATAQTVAVTDATAGATLYYTTDGTTPTASSTKYTGPIKVGATETVKVVAAAPGKATSAVSTAKYTIELPADSPAFSVASGTYSAEQMVTLTSKTPGAAIYYTTNGATPTTASTRYASPIAVTATETVKSIATAANHTQSAVGAATYAIEKAGASN